ncbi:MAG: large-conductance mechanosensitive channel protein MscL [Candidatus Omnitrophica bacterium]|nr:large-conductance mechanosensitive channel protein MscL [Candidatus Omnitrophota bacterium]
MLKEFQQFAMRGNVIDMAVGIIIGSAFGKIISSLVEDIIMPPIGYLMGGMDFSNLKIILKEATDKAPIVAIKYGVFINVIINFTIVAFAMFMLIRAMNTLKKKEEVAPSAPPKPSNQELLLAEIRDLLKKK